MVEVLVRLPDHVAKDELTKVEIVGFGIDHEGLEESLPSDDAHCWRVLLMYREAVNGIWPGRSGGVRPFTRDFTNQQAARTYAWQLAARFGLQVQEY